MGRPPAGLTLTDDERSDLLGWARTAQAHALRARIILVCAEGGNNGEVADELGITRQMVGKWRQCFMEKRLHGLVKCSTAGDAAHEHRRGR